VPVVAGADEIRLVADGSGSRVCPSLPQAATTITNAWAGTTDLIAASGTARAFRKLG
jgi:hypothetical protein